MKRQALTAMALLGTLAAQAADYQYLTIEKKDGTALSMTAVGLNITYANGRMTATNGTETATLALTELSRMFFSNTKDATAIATIENLQPETAATVYDLSGRLVASEVMPSALSSQLRKGVYIVRQNTKTVKIQVK
ncbi:MAG: T9SS type A sorting domain-containing protein [Prevotella sp.]|nr:T9SS type A sorting domain-containing protein [Prevotella sp.]